MNPMQRMNNNMMNMNQTPMMNMNQTPMMNMNQMPMMNMNQMPMKNMNQMPMMNMNQMSMMNMNQMQLVSQINALSEKNKSLEKKLNDLEQKFQDYQNKMESILFYNEIDPNSYTLDYVFNNLSSNEIIHNKEEIRLINNGIKHLFNKNIICLECKYQSKVENFNPDQFKQIFNNINYSLIIILTKHENKRFGAFSNNNSMNNNNQMNNQMMMQNNPNMIHQNQNLGLDDDDFFFNQMNQMNNQNMTQQNQNLADVDTIFESKSNLNNYFTFSLDKIRIYYKEKNIQEHMVPNFNLVYNKRHESLLGNEFPINNENNILDYKLTGNQEFKVKYLELYEITI